MQENYDIIVAGAGLSGSLAAAMAAQAGAKVLLLDRNQPAVVGKKTNWGWVCGNAVAKSHLDYIKQKVDLGFTHPELDMKVDGVVALSPDLKSRYLFDGEGYTLDRPALIERKLISTHLMQEQNTNPNLRLKDR